MQYNDKLNNKKTVNNRIINNKKGDNFKSSTYHAHIKKKSNVKKKRKKRKIPFKLRQQVWLNTNGKNYECKCFVDWCSNTIDVFNYQVGHDIPESKGGTLSLDNLKPICSNCNLSMSNNYTIKEWNNIINNENNNKNHNTKLKDIFKRPINYITNKIYKWCNIF